MTSNGRVARLTALALATGTLVAAGAGSAGAATTTKTTYTATGGGSVLRLTVNLPVALPGIGQTLTQDLVLTGSNVRTGDSAAAITSSILGANGTVPLVSGLLDKSVTAEYGKPQPAAVNAFPDLSALGITGKLLSLESKAGNPNVDGPVAHSLSTVTDLRVEGAGNLNAVLDALTAQLQSIVTNAIGTLPGSSSGSSAGAVTAPVTSTVSGLVGTLTSQLDALTKNTTAPLSDAAKQAVQTVIDQLNALPSALLSQLTAKLTAASADTSLLHVGLIQSEQTVSRTASAVTSDSSQKLIGVSVLGGLVTVDGLSSAATAVLGNGISTATPDLGRNGVLHAAINKDLLTVDLNNGLTAALGSSALPPQVVTAVNGALDQIGTVLNGILGTTLRQTAVGTNVATADKASSSVNAAELVVNPAIPGLSSAAKPLVDVQFVPAAAEVVKAQATTNPTLVSTPAQAGSAPQALARTGADLPLTGAVAAALMGLAAIARRRRAGGLAE